MKKLFLTLLVLTAVIRAEDAPTPAPSTPSGTNNSTTITSDSLDLNLGKKM
jgi:hypothetical protein